MEKERQNKFSFLDVEVVREQGKFTTTISRKPSLSGVYSNFESFLPPVYGVRFRICSDLTKFHAE